MMHAAVDSPDTTLTKVGDRLTPWSLVWRETLVYLKCVYAAEHARAIEREA